jgi:hypothetical protein
MDGDYLNVDLTQNLFPIGTECFATKGKLLMDLENKDVEKSQIIEGRDTGHI